MEQEYVFVIKKLKEDDTDQSTKEERDRKKDLVKDYKEKFEKQHFVVDIYRPEKDENDNDNDDKTYFALSIDEDKMRIRAEELKIEAVEKECDILLRYDRDKKDNFYNFPVRQRHTIIDSLICDALGNREYHFITNM